MNGIAPSKCVDPNREKSMIYEDEVERLYEEETAPKTYLFRAGGPAGYGTEGRGPAGDGVWREQPTTAGLGEPRNNDAFGGDNASYSGHSIRPRGESYESDRYDPANPNDEAAGWLAYHAGTARDGTQPSTWLAGYDQAALSGIEPYAFTQERMRLQELRDELGPDFLTDVRNSLRVGGFTQADLAKAMGLPKQNISRWLTGVVTPTLESMLAMRDALVEMENG